MRIRSRGAAQIGVCLTVSFGAVSALVPPARPLSAQFSFPSQSSLLFRSASASSAASTSSTTILSDDVSPFDCPEWQSWDATFIQEQQAAVPAVQVVDSMPPNLLPSTAASSNLKNSYYLFRHGQSTANLAEIISSDRDSLAYATRHGLTAMGYQQGRDAASQLLDLLSAPQQQHHQSSSAPKEQDNTKNEKKRVVFISSPFARARQTAQACLDGLLNSNIDESETENARRVQELSGLDIDPKIKLNNLLVERSFGRLDGERIYTYAFVWPLDKFNVTHTAFAVESVAAVCHRLRTLIVDELEEQYQGCHLVLTSHADVLQIAQLYAAKPDAVGYFSSYRFKSELVIGKRKSAKLRTCVSLLTCLICCCLFL